MNARTARWAAIVLLPLLTTCEQHPLVSDSSPSVTVTPAATTGSTTSAPGQGKKDGWDIATAFGTVLAAIFAAVSACFSFAALKQTNRTQKQARIEAQHERMAALWQIMENFRFLSPSQLANFDTPDVTEIVRKNVNTMGQVGYLWSVGLIDRKAAERELSPFYVQLFEQIGSLGHLTMLGRSGADLIAENGYAQKLYRELKQHPHPN